MTTFPTATSLPEVLEAMAALYATLPALANVPISNGTPDRGTLDSDEFVALLDADDLEQEARSMNVTNQPRMEEYTVRVLISVVAKGADDDVAISARAAEIFGAIVLAHRQNPTLSGLYTGNAQIIHALGVIAGTFTRRQDSAGLEREAAFSFGVGVRARI